MVRKLKYHEQKLLRKVDFVTYKSDQGHRDALVIRRYAIQNPEDYRKYNRIVGSIHKLAHQLAALDPASAFRHKHTALLLSKLHAMGLLTHDPMAVSRGGVAAGSSSTFTSGEQAPSSSATTARLSDVPSKITVSALCRRRLPVVMTRLHMAETVQAATKLVEQGHVRVGTEVVTDTAFLVTRAMEDWVTWAVGSKIKRTVEAYRGGVDDFELL